MADEEKPTQSPPRRGAQERRRAKPKEDTVEGASGRPAREGPKRGKTAEGAKLEKRGVGLKPGKAARGPKSADGALQAGAPRQTGETGAALQAEEAGDAGAAPKVDEAGRAVKPGKADRALKPGTAVKGLKPRKADRPGKPRRRVESGAAGEGIESLTPDQGAPAAGGRLRRTMHAIAAVTAVGMLVLSLLGLEASSDFFLASAVALPVLVLAYFAGPGGAVTGRSVAVIFVLATVGEAGALYALAAGSSNPASVGLAVGGLAGIALLIAVALWIPQRPTGLG